MAAGGLVQAEDWIGQEAGACAGLIAPLSCYDLCMVLRMATSLLANAGTQEHFPA